jgi:hypothetical protein
MGLLVFGLNVTLDGCIDHTQGIVDDVRKGHAEEFRRSARKDSASWAPKAPSENHMSVSPVVGDALWGLRNRDSLARLRSKRSPVQRTRF